MIILQGSRIRSSDFRIMFIISLHISSFKLFIDLVLSLQNLFHFLIRNCILLTSNYFFLKSYNVIYVSVLSKTIHFSVRFISESIFAPSFVGDGPDPRGFFLLVHVRTCRLVVLHRIVKLFQIHKIKNVNVHSCSSGCL